MAQKRKSCQDRKGHECSILSGSPALGLVRGGLNCPKKCYMCVCKRQREIKRETACESVCKRQKSRHELNIWLHTEYYNDCGAPGSDQHHWRESVPYTSLLTLFPGSFRNLLSLILMLLSFLIHCVTPESAESTPCMEGSLGSLPAAQRRESHVRINFMV